MNFKKARLLRANNRQHIQSLSKAIDKDLQTLKQQLPKAAYQQLQRANVQFRNQQDIEALLAFAAKNSHHGLANGDFEKPHFEFG